MIYILIKVMHSISDKNNINSYMHNSWTSHKFVNDLSENCVSVSRLNSSYMNMFNSPDNSLSLLHFLVYHDP